MNDVSKTREVVTAGVIHTAHEEGAARAIGVFHVEIINGDNVTELDCLAYNALTNEGANYLRDCLFNLNGVTLMGTALSIGLATAAPSATSTLSTITEANGGGYTRKTPAWTGTNPGSANNTASVASWTATGTAMNGVSHLFVTNATSGTSGRLISWAALPNGPYNINVNSVINVTYTWSVT